MVASENGGNRAKRVVAHAAAAAALAFVLLSARRGSAEPSAAAVSTETAGRASHDAWTARYENARRRLLAGHYALAATDFEGLVRDATTDADRLLADEMRRLAEAWQRVSPDEATPAPGESSRVRTKDEIATLYASAFLYGAGTGAWFLLQTQPDSALTATLPFAAFTAAPLVALATIDGRDPLPRGLPQAMSTGLYLGLGEGVWVVAYNHARASRLYGGESSGHRWRAETVSSILWAGATVGAVSAGAIASGLRTTPGRISFTASTTLWAAIVSSLAASAVLPNTAYRAEQAAVVAGVGYNTGLFGGMILAGRVSPSVSRVRLVDLSGATGAIAAGGIYLSIAQRDSESHAALGVTTLGAIAGLTLGTLLTAGMAPELPASRSSSGPLTWQPVAMPVAGGGLLGIGGFM